MDSVAAVWLHVMWLHDCLRVGLTRCKDFDDCSIFPGPVSTWKNSETVYIVSLHILSPSAQSSSSLIGD